jgi:quercetin dioxygenase-like cupin family protein
VIADATTAETITDQPGRSLLLLHTSPSLTVTWTRHDPGQEGTDLHVHHEHTDAFYVLDGELTVPLGPDGMPTTLAAGTFASIPPDVAHAFVNASDAPVSFLNLHAPDGGFIAFLRGLRDGAPASWDSFPPPADGGRPASEALVVTDGAAALREAGVVVLEATADTLRLEVP